MSNIKERPILFSAPMVRAILEGRKTVTRRVMKSQPDPDATITVESYNVAVTNRQGYQEAGPEIFGAWWRDGESGCKCPYGQPGDRLWVRETHADIGCRLTYRADTDDGAHCKVKRWTPAIHMFRRHSRILLEITDVRVERLQDISEAQALAEGIVGVAFRPDDGWPICTGYMVGPDDGKTGLQTTAAKAFSGLWDSVGGDWYANAWVWVVEFKRLTP
ncbi:hypothetical protein ALQ18_01198 [Pseudomonas marginalis pv. marginalis]|nr:hypothetical protein ALQ18_01198 [Pseudomonas marginalis pv. marginalis]